MFENARGSYGYYPEKLRVRCSDQGCSGQTGWFQHGESDYDETPVAKSKAITAWNTRASEAHTLRVAEAVREACAGKADGWDGADGFGCIIAAAIRALDIGRIVEGVGRG